MSPYDTDGGAVALLLVFGFIWLLIAVAAYVVSSIFMMKVFDKAGVQGKWRAWVPIYNTMIFAKLGDLNPWWLLIAWVAAGVLAPVGIGGLFGLAAAVYTALAAYRVGLKLQKEPVWVVLYIFLSIVWLGIVAFDRSRWSLAVPPAPWANSFLRDTTTWSGIPAQNSGVGFVGGGYTAAPGYPAQPPAGYQPPPAPGGYPPPAATQPPPYQPPAAPTTPPAAPEPPAAPPTTEPPASPEPPKQP
ncbi:large exoprotein [Microbacterium sp. Sa4CUA7]|uniref:Large exoprotein n=1 Tax=Microbacterium pullorum TaxID=2762236 RepID=A0ABR8S0V1_9MICO|nr:DUF5684 domain-containing protein [Microbacterium pullorum]MBD7957098.1 large exoprotein [Microbacterium pullorum]